jgi:CheY-like chemotaxis protein
MTQPTVLIVDDDRDLRASLCDALNDEGYRTIDASDGREALERLRTERPDVIVLDMMMPVMNGWQFREEQLRDPALAKIPVIVLSAMGHDDLARIDADEVLFKPITLDQLLTSVARYCKR